ncbi:MAG: hypothetical protein GY754_11245 [bacterium]|nr:hypothetical protein [bacterium]
MPETSTIPQKLDLDQADVEIGGITVISALELKWDVSQKTADTMKNGRIISTAEADEQVKGSMTIEQWEIGFVEKQTREKGKKNGTLVGIITSINVVDKWGRFFKAPKVRITKGGVKFDSKAADDKGSLDFCILDTYEANIHGGTE